MEALAFYLLKSVVWITGFTLVYVLFLRNERFFLLNRVYLLSGIIVSLVFPFITVRYVADLPAGEAGAGALAAASPDTAAMSVAGTFSIILLLLYSAGALFVAARYLAQVRSVMRAVSASDIDSGYTVRLIRSHKFVTPFSFFSCVFVNPSVSETETREIVNHEVVHIRQKHWLDLVMMGLLSVVQWFNPVVRFYSMFVRQNHEYLADEGALRRTSDPVMYRAALLNQIAGAPVLDLCNSFNYSLNVKRFRMMKNTVTSPIRRLKFLIVIPVFAIVLYAFAEPEYRVSPDNMSPSYGSAALTKEVTGVIVGEDGMPLPGANIVIKGTSVGTVSDGKGMFKLTDVPAEAVLVVSYVGYESKVMKPVFGSSMTVQMMKKTILVETVSVPPPPPPPPPPPSAGKDGEKYTMVEELPQFPGGEGAMMTWVASNVKYPAEAVKANVTGKVLVGFTVSETGKVKDVKVVKSVHQFLDAEAVRVISSMPDWKPGSQDGKPVAVQFVVPVEFKLGDKVPK